MKYLLEYLDSEDRILSIGKFNSLKEIDKFLEEAFRIKGEFPLYSREYEESGMVIFDFGDFTETYFISEQE